MSLSKFPNFQPFSLADKDEYLSYYSTMEYPYCDFSLNDLWIWLNYKNDLAVCTLNNNLVLKFTNIFDDKIPYYTLLGHSHLNTTFKELVQFGITKLTFLPEETAQAILLQTNYQHEDVKEDSDNGDYVYSVDDLVALQGKKYENLRRRINHFSRENPNIQIKELDLSNKSTHEFIKSSILKWSHAHNDPENLEFSAIERHLKLAKTLPVYAYGLYSNEKLININIFHLPPHQGWVIFNHIKCDYSYPDIYGYAFYSLFVTIQAKGFKWVNFEQDLGMEGLRRIKLFFRPAMLLRRYTIVLDSEREA